MIIKRGACIHAVVVEEEEEADTDDKVGSHPSSKEVMMNVGLVGDFFMSYVAVLGIAKSINKF